MLSALTLGAQDINLNLDFKNSQIRSQRIELGLEVNPSTSFNGTLKISFGTTSSSVSMTTHVVASISDQEDFTAYENNTKTYYFKQENLTPNTTYYFKWWLESSTFGNIEKQVTALTTAAPFSVLPSQKFEIPEEGLIPGDTIGFLKYDDTDGSWSKVQTAYKTTIGLKTDGSLWAWGRNAKRIIVNPASRSEVVYEPVQVIMPPDPANFDSDGDGYWDVDENLNSQSDPTTSTSVPTDTDEDMFSDAFEISLGFFLRSFLEEFIEKIFWEKFFGRKFYGSNFGGNFLGGFFGEELFVYIVKVI